MIELLGLTPDEVAAQARRLMPDGGHGVAHAIYAEALRTGRFTPENHGLRAAAVDAWRKNFALTLPEVARVVEEPDDAGRMTAKAVLRSADGLEHECVLIPMPTGKNTLCVSSQVGCKMGCTFCETGKMGLVRQLAAHEIVAQLVVARAVLGWSVSNLVFMGMGEALDNVDALLVALRVLNDRRGVDLSLGKVKVCTVGHADGLERLAAAGLKRLNLSVSLNAPNDALRASIMPITKKYPLARLKAALLAYAPRPGFVLAVNYCLLPGVNDRPEHVDEIVAFFDGLGRAMLNVIPYNPGSAPVTRAPTDDEVDAFIATLSARGLYVTRRVTRGRSVMAACGQLGNVELRRSRRRDAPPSLPVL